MSFRAHRRGIVQDEPERSTPFVSQILHADRAFERADDARRGNRGRVRAFPGRRIGALRDGYDASFLVLGGDPLSDFVSVRRIVLAVKKGVVLVSGERTKE